MLFRPSGAAATLEPIAQPLDDDALFDRQMTALLADALRPCPAGAGRRRRRLAVQACRPDAPQLVAALDRLPELRAADIELSVILGRTWPAGAALERVASDVGADSVRLARFRGVSALRERSLFGALAEWTGARFADARSGPAPGSGRVEIFDAGRSGSRRMARAHARFEDVWASARSL